MKHVTPSNGPFTDNIRKIQVSSFKLTLANKLKVTLLIKQTAYVKPLNGKAILVYNTKEDGLSSTTKLQYPYKLI